MLALRVTYVGELGWELHVPVEFAATVYDALIEAGRPHGLANAGYRAIESLRLEKGYRAWGADIGPDHSPLMAGPRLGGEARARTSRSSAARRSRRSAARPLPRLLAGFTVDDPDVVLLGRETIYRDGQRVGWLASGGFGYTVGQGDRLRLRARPGAASTPTWCCPAATSWRSPPSACRRRSFLRPLYDPEMTRVRA